MPVMRQSRLLRCAGTLCKQPTSQIAMTGPRPTGLWTSISAQAQSSTVAQDGAGSCLVSGKNHAVLQTLAMCHDECALHAVNLLSLRCVCSDLCCGWPCGFLHILVTSSVVELTWRAQTTYDSRVLLRILSRCSVSCSDGNLVSSGRSTDARHRGGGVVTFCLNVVNVVVHVVARRAW